MSAPNPKSDQSLGNYNANEYWTSRDFHTSARLHLQHWIWIYQLGYALHPDIPKDRSGLKVADVACGNCVWLIDLLPVLPKDTKYHGFDLSPTNFPAKEWLPENISTHVLDAFTPDLPEEWVGKFDIVHVRAIISAVKDNHIEPLIKNLVKMLKPGGYLQWDESYPGATIAQSPNASVSREASTELLKLLQYFGTMFKVLEDWLKFLPKTLREHGMDVVFDQEMKPKKELMKAWTDDLLMVYEEIQWSLPLEKDMKAGGPGDGLSREKYQALFARVLEETAKGVSLSIEQRVIVARKE